MAATHTVTIRALTLGRLCPHPRDHLTHNPFFVPTGSSLMLGKSELKYSGGIGIGPLHAPSPSPCLPDPAPPHSRPIRWEAHAVFHGLRPSVLPSLDHCQQSCKGSKSPGRQDAHTGWQVTHSIPSSYPEPWLWWGSWGGAQNKDSRERAAVWCPREEGHSQHFQVLPVGRTLCQWCLRPGHPTQLSWYQPCEGDIITIPILQVRKLRLREVK